MILNETLVIYFIKKQRNSFELICRLYKHFFSFYYCLTLKELRMKFTFSIVIYVQKNV